MQLATQAIKDLIGKTPSGWYTGRDSPNTRRLLLDQGDYLYDSDYYGDDLPFWTQVSLSDGQIKPHLIIPYTLDANDMRFASPQGFNTADHFFTSLNYSYDTLYKEGDPAGLNQPKMMSIGMHCRLLGRPGRVTALQKFLDYIQQIVMFGYANVKTSPSIGYTCIPRLMCTSSDPSGISAYVLAQ